MRLSRHLVLTSVIGATLALLATARADEPKLPAAPGLGDPGKLVSLAIETGHTVDGNFVLPGQDARQQLVVTGTYSTGQVRDLTRDVTYELAPAGIVQIDKAGLVVPLADGKATLTAKSAVGVVVD